MKKNSVLSIANSKNMSMVTVPNPSRRLVLDVTIVHVQVRQRPETSDVSKLKK